MEPKKKKKSQWDKYAEIIEEPSDYYTCTECGASVEVGYSCPNGCDTRI